MCLFSWCRFQAAECWSSNFIFQVLGTTTTYLIILIQFAELHNIWTTILFLSRYFMCPLVCAINVWVVLCLDKYYRDFDKETLVYLFIFHIRNRILLRINRLICLMCSEEFWQHVNVQNCASRLLNGMFLNVFGTNRNSLT